jgi:hypothetical protein
MLFFDFFIVVLVDNTQLSNLRRSLWYKAPLLGSLVMRPSRNGACLSTWPELSSSGTIPGMMVGLPPIASLHSPFEGSSSAVVDHIQAGAGSSPITGPSPKKVDSGGLSMVAPGCHVVEFDLGKDSFAWPHPTCPSKALFKVDDVAELAMGEVTSRGREGSRQPWPRWAARPSLCGTLH